MAILLARDPDYYYDNSRYAFVGFAVAAIIVFVTVTCYVNFRRAKRGQTPIVASFLTPPSYGQSQVAYEGQVVTDLPTYTADPNPIQDVGYYDINGNFIPADQTNTVHKTTNVIQLDDQTFPRAHTQPTGSSSNEIGFNTNGVVYERPPVPPPSRNINQNLNNNNDLPDYSPPPFDPFTPEHTGSNQNQHR